MPVYRINILFANGKSYKEYHLVDGVELDAYYKRLARLAQMSHVPVVSFDVVQVSKFSREATLMRPNNIKRMSRYVPNVQPRKGSSKRRRRL
jgi:hypothetical protein